MRSKLRERRLEMLDKYAMSLNLGPVVTDLASKYGVSKQAIYNDWRRRERWIDDITEFRDRDGFIKIMLRGLANLIPKAQFQYLQNRDKPAIALGAIKALTDIYSRIIAVTYTLQDKQAIQDLFKLPFTFDDLSESEQTVVLQFTQLLSAKYERGEEMHR